MPMNKDQQVDDSSSSAQTWDQTPNFDCHRLARLFNLEAELHDAIRSGLNLPYNTQQSIRCPPYQPSEHITWRRKTVIQTTQTVQINNTTWHAIDQYIHYASNLLLATRLSGGVIVRNPVASACFILHGDLFCLNRVIVLSDDRTSMSSQHGEGLKAIWFTEHGRVRVWAAIGGGTTWCLNGVRSTFAIIPDKNMHLWSSNISISFTSIYNRHCRIVLFAMSFALVNSPTKVHPNVSTIWAQFHYITNNVLQHYTNNRQYQMWGSEFCTAILDPTSFPPNRHAGAESPVSGTNGSYQHSTSELKKICSKHKVCNLQHWAYTRTSWFCRWKTRLGVLSSLLVKILHPESKNCRVSIPLQFPNLDMPKVSLMSKQGHSLDHTSSASLSTGSVNSPCVKPFFSKKTTSCLWGFRWVEAIRLPLGLTRSN